MVDAPTIPRAHLRPGARPAVGYSMVLVAALLFGVNGTVSKVVLGSGITSLELTQVRSTGAALGFLAAVLATRPAALRATRRARAVLALLGLAGGGGVPGG